MLQSLKVTYYYVCISYQCIFKTAFNNRWNLKNVIFTRLLFLFICMLCYNFKYRFWLRYVMFIRISRANTKENAYLFTFNKKKNHIDGLVWAGSREEWNVLSSRREKKDENKSLKASVELRKVRVQATKIQQSQ